MDKVLDLFTFIKQKNKLYTYIEYKLVSQACNL